MPFESGQFGLQPRAVDRGDPGQLACRGAWSEGEVCRIGVGEDRLLEHARQRRAQPAGRSLRQRDAVPGDVGLADHRNHTVGLGQVGRTAATLRLHRETVAAEQVVELVIRRR
jgi:hypothetical protein